MKKPRPSSGARGARQHPGETPTPWHPAIAPAEVQARAGDGAVQGARRGSAAQDEALFARCPSCKEIAYRKDLERRLNVCGGCGHHFRLTVEQRLLITIDRGSFAEIDASLSSGNPLEWADLRPYPERIAEARAQTGRDEAVVTGFAAIEGVAVALGIFDFNFLGGSMGSVVGEKITRLTEQALSSKLPLVLITASGGARMQEGTLSLFQMAKVTAALDRLRQAALPYLCVLTDPTTGGVAASLAMLGDVQIAEPDALIGFAGPRVIEQTIHQSLPKGFQRSGSVLEHGMLDMVVHRRELKAALGRVLRALTRTSAAQS